MQVFQIIAEQNELDEAIPFTKKARMMKQAKKAAKGATKDEARQIEVELLTYLKTSKQKATADAVMKYFDQKGLGNIAADVVGKYQTKGMKKQARSDSRAAKAQAAGAAAAKLGGMAKVGAQKAGAAIGKAATAAKNASGVVPKDQIQAASMYEAAPGDILTKREVRDIIKQVVAKGYGGSAGFDKSRFAQGDEPKASFKSQRAAPDAETQAAIDKLKAAGYKISK